MAMATTRAASSTVRCLACQRQVLGAFISTFSPAVRPAFRDVQSPQLPRQKRTITTGTLRRSSVVPQHAQDITPSPSEDVTTDGAASEEVQAQDSPKPWYLQLVDADPEAKNPFAQRQQLPDLPPNPPPLLQSLLKQISIDLGLDYLRIIDLRSLDPPPALGAGLIMIFGSARSEKHLNVSADRLCRWLRSTHKLTPAADGLLGRNELKLKLRRKARRSRVLGAVGATEPTNPDDGITTGWICVNVGEVENGPEATRETQAARTGFVGFGSQSDGARIVVQMMTEEKRGEVDLETLWQSVLEREGRKKEGERRAWERLEQESSPPEEARDQRQSGIEMSDPSRYGRQVPFSTSSLYPSQQVREYHTSQRHYRADESRLNENKMEEPNEDDLEPHLLPSTALSDGAIGDLGRFGAESVSISHQTGIKSPAKAFDDVASALSLRTQLDYLKKRKASVAHSLLGSGDHDRSSTDFLASFYQSFPPFPNIEHWICLVELQCYALRLGQPNYSRIRLVQMFRDMQGASIWIPEQIFMHGLETILLSSHELDSDTVLQANPELNRLNALRRSLGFAFELIERMEAHGHPVRTEPIFLLLLEAISNPPNPPSKPPSKPDPPAPERSFLAPHNIDKLQHRFRRALDLLYTPSTTTTNDPIYLALMETCIRLGHWSGFWESWRHMARMMRRRGPAMYALMFAGVARTGDQARCQQVLMALVPEMERESPTVGLEGEVARGVLECLVVAKVDPGVAPWREMVEECRRGFGAR